MTPGHLRQPTPWLIAHRGARDEAPENTASAFDRALAYPIDGIELDVQLSADGVPVVYHDRTLLRVSRTRRRVAELTCAQLSTIDWGHWYGRSFAGEPLLTLERTLDLWGGRTRLMVEIKIHPGDHASGHAERLTRKTVDLLERYSTRLSEDRIYILSFDAQALRLARRLAPRWRYVLNLSQKEPNAITGIGLETSRPYWAINVRIDWLSPALVAWARKQGMGIWTYTCNSRRQLDKALKRGVDAILSDRPGWLTDCLMSPETLL